MITAIVFVGSGLILFDLFNIIPLMTVERERPKDIIHRPDFEIIGKGSIGAKARELQNKASILKAVGFNIPRTTVLAEGFFDGFFRRNALGGNLREASKVSNIQSGIGEGYFSSDDLKTLKKVTSSYGNTPLVIRSSAEGDARGTGIYESVFTDNKIEGVRKGIQKVLASYYSPSATAFRRDAKTDEGFGVIIQPLVGQVIYSGERKIFAPVLSGFGYTSREEGYINVVPGIGGGVETGCGERLTKAALEPYNGNLKEYVEDVRSMMTRNKIVKRKSALLRTMGIYDLNSINVLFETMYNLKGYFLPYKNLDGRASDISSNLDQRLNTSFQKVNLNPLFDNMQKMEQAFGKPQYLEWAMTLEKGKPKYWVVQIADIDKKKDIFDFEKFGEPFIEAHMVTGSGVKDVNAAIFCSDPHEIDLLNYFNEKHKNYLLFITSSLTSDACKRWRYENGGRNLEFADINNASVIIEVSDAEHLSEPKDHFKGSLDITGKLFGVTKFDRDDNKFCDKWRDFWRRDSIKKNSNMKIRENIKAKVVGSERQNRLVIFENK